MALDEYLESEVAVAIAATAVTLSPRARRIVRRGMVYGLAGVLTAGDAIASFTRGAARGARQTTDLPVPAAAGTAVGSAGVAPGVEDGA